MNAGSIAVGATSVCIVVETFLGLGRSDPRTDNFLGLPSGNEERFINNQLAVMRLSIIKLNNEHWRVHEVEHKTIYP